MIAAFWPPALIRTHQKGRVGSAYAHDVVERKEAKMHDRQIPRTEWLNFFRDFSRRHEDSLVTVRILSDRLGSQVEACDLPLEGIVASPKLGDPISIHVGRTPQQHIEHEVSHPRQVWLEVLDDGTEDALDIESEDGTKTLVLFRAETVDDVLRRAC
jgi:hypothetical protein